MIHLVVTVENTAELLATEAYGAGALLRWESSALAAGPFVEGGTVALVSGTSFYDIWDAAGVTGTWYQTRISDSGGTTFSAYSIPFQSSSYSSGLTVDQFRAFQATSLADPELGILLAAAWDEIEDAIGRLGPITERLTAGHGDLLLLSREAESITAIVEDARHAALTLEADDYELSDSGMLLYRLATGTNPSLRWRGRVDVTYVVADDTEQRKRVQRDLVMLDLIGAGAITSERIGDWQQTFAASSDPAATRAAILSTIGAGPGIG